MYCAHCHQLMPENLNCADHLKYDLVEDQMPEALKELFEKEGTEYGLHEGCAKVVIKEEKLRYYKKVLEPIFRKLNRSQINHYDVDAIVEAFFCSHRYLQNEAVLTLRSIISGIGQHAGDVHYEDARNQYGLAWCKKASKEN